MQQPIQQCSASADLIYELINLFSHLQFIESLENYNNLLVAVIWKKILLNTSKWTFQLRISSHAMSPAYISAGVNITDKVELKHIQHFIHHLQQNEPPSQATRWIDLSLISSWLALPILSYYQYNKANYFVTM